MKVKTILIVTTIIIFSSCQTGPYRIKQTERSGYMPRAIINIQEKNHIFSNDIISIMIYSRSEYFATPSNYSFIAYDSAGNIITRRRGGSNMRYNQTLNQWEGFTSLAIPDINNYLPISLHITSVIDSSRNSVYTINQR